ncbi:MAG: hypothetical protein HFI33_13420 [Lachnospiraceae bacterium]|nr:hypothetical protein [Lachnospiraceae bacterium]
MALIYNNTTIPNGANLTYGNVALEKIIYHGVTVWVKQILRPGSILSVSASGGTYPDLISFTYPNITASADHTGKPVFRQNHYWDNRAWLDSYSGEGANELIASLKGGCIHFKKDANITVALTSLSFIASGTPNGIYNNWGDPKLRKNRIVISAGARNYMNSTSWQAIPASSYPPAWTGNVKAGDWIDLWCDGMSFGGGSNSENDTTAWGQMAAIYATNLKITINSI